MRSAGSNGSVADADLDGTSAGFEGAPPEAIVRWAVRSFAPDLCLAASMTDAVLIDVAMRVDPSTEIVFIDTGYHFDETLDMLDRVVDRYGCPLRVMRPDLPPEPLWKTDPENCCSPLKVAQLDLALAGKRAWMSGLRRADSPTRAHAPIVGRDRRGLVKVNPLATWSDEDVLAYVREHDVPVNALVEQGYPSIGCWPCTRPVGEGEPSRAGRWPASQKTECGLHF